LPSRTLSWAWCSFCCAAIAWSTAIVDASPGEALLRSVALLEQGEAARACREADDVLARSQPTPLGLSVKGAGQLSMYEIGDARDSFGAALGLDPNYVPALMGMAVCAVRDGAFGDAADIYRRILDGPRPAPAGVGSALAFALMAGGDMRGALDQTSALRRAGLTDALACHVEAVALVEIGDVGRALTALTKATALDRGEPVPPVMTPMVICIPDVVCPSQQPVASTRENTAYLHSLTQRTTSAPPAIAAVPSLPPDDQAPAARRSPRHARPTTPSTGASAKHTSTTRSPAGSGQGAADVAPAPPAAGERLTIASPINGQRVSGFVDVQVSVADLEELSYVTLSVDGAFRSMSNLPPFRLSLDTTPLSDGPHRLRATAHDRAGLVVESAETLIVVANTQHTSAAEEERLVSQAGERLATYLSLRPHPLDRTYLAGWVSNRAGRTMDAVAAYEYVFSTQPLYPGVHADLIVAYSKLGLLRSDGPGGRGAAALEIRRLPPDTPSPEGGAAARPRIALTFDDGPNPSLTASILDDLDAVGAKATFFVVGKQAELYPELVRAIHDRGHELACHSYSHTNQSHLPTVEIERELVKTRAIIREITGDTVVYFRPPGGRYDDDVQRAVGEMGYSTVWWTTAITQYPDLPADVVLKRLLGDIGPGAIVLLHNGFDETVPVLRPLLRELRSRGYDMVTLSEGLGRSRPPASMSF
jgi:peptidoglycan/xylan/chitin deacetylase (PgdA/CDA1 family)/Flp pilus assembly protein TadD